MDLPFWTAGPFAVLLGCVALLPVVRGAWWHHNRSKALVAAACALPVAGYLVWHGPEGRHALGHELLNYLSFVVLLTALYVIAGGVAVTGGVRATPGGNALLLAGGAVLANVVGTTGASMLLVRPFLRANGGRTRRRHLPVFFIFMVCNTGGLLTPLGDPPLFLGYLNGVPFAWTLRLWPQWLAVNAALLMLFVVVDALAARAERRSRGPDAPVPASPGPVRVAGLALNGPLLAGVVLAVAFQKQLPHLAAEAVMAALTLVSLWRTPRTAREANRFTWGPAVEVAVLFAGIFVAMTPALALLQQHGGRLGLTEPWQFFWATGVLSSALDNAPTYLTLGTVAADGRGLGWLAANDPLRLAAVSCGAVFMGANSYVGNGPNFLVKAVAEDAGYPVPSFLGYVALAALVLGPVFVGVTAAFFG